MALTNGITMQHCGGLALLGVGVLLHIVGLSTPSWSTLTIQSSSSSYSDNTYRSTSSSTTTTIGLWKWCAYSKDCVDIPAELMTDAWKAACAFAILGMLAGLVALGLSCLHFVMMLQNKNEMEILKRIVVAAGAVSLVFVVICTSCYGGGVHDKFNVPDLKIGYSFILSIIGGIIICIGGVVFYVASMRKT